MSTLETSTAPESSETAAVTDKETETPGTPKPSGETSATNDTSTTPQTVSSKAKAAPSSGPPSAVEFEPPVACVRRILKKTLPSSSNVGKDAVAAFARASGIFIIYLTACANDFARENRRQTITANDVLAAVKELEFDEFAPELSAFLENYRASEKSKKNAKAKAAAERAKNNATGATKSENKEEEDETKEDIAASKSDDVDGDVSMDAEEDDQEEGGNNDNTDKSSADDSGNVNGETASAANEEKGENESNENAMEE